MTLVEKASSNSNPMAVSHAVVELIVHISMSSWTFTAKILNWINRKAMKNEPINTTKEKRRKKWTKLSFRGSTSTSYISYTLLVVGLKKQSLDKELCESTAAQSATSWHCCTIVRMRQFLHFLCVRVCAYICPLKNIGFLPGEINLWDTIPQ